MGPLWHSASLQCITAPLDMRTPNHGSRVTSRYLARVPFFFASSSSAPALLLLSFHSASQIFFFQFPPLFFFSLLYHDARDGSGFTIAAFSPGDATRDASSSTHADTPAPTSPSLRRKREREYDCDRHSERSRTGQRTRLCER